MIRFKQNITHITILGYNPIYSTLLRVSTLEGHIDRECEY